MLASTTNVCKRDDIGVGEIRAVKRHRAHRQQNLQEGRLERGLFESSDTAIVSRSGWKLAVKKSTTMSQ